MISNIKVAAVVVSFNPENTLLDKLCKFSSNVDWLIVYDNTEYGVNERALIANINKLHMDNIIYLGSNENVGIATALNISIRKCLELGVTHVFLFDQDSDVHSVSFFKTMIDGLEDVNSVNSSIVSLCPNIIDEGNLDAAYKWLVKHSKFQFLFSRKSFSGGSDIYPLIAITSGSLFLSKVFNDIGYFKDEYFIDYVDTEYCLRLNRNGYKIKACQDALLLHNLGAKTNKSLFWITFYPTNHSEVRRYYIARNSVDMWRNYALIIPAWALFDLLASLYNAFRIICFESNRIKKIKYSCWGFIDGLNKKMGRNYFK